MSATPPSVIERPAWLPTKRWPYDIETVTVDGHPFTLTDVGDGPTLLLVHAGTWSFIWRDLIERLRTGFQVITFDPPATGLSATDRDAGIEQAARVVDAIVHRFDLRLVAVNTFGWRPSGLLFRSMLHLMGTR